MCVCECVCVMVVDDVCCVYVLNDDLCDVMWWLSVSDGVCVGILCVVLLGWSANGEDVCVLMIG